MPIGTDWELSMLVVCRGDRDRRQRIVLGGRTTSFDAPIGVSSVRIVETDREMGRERSRSGGGLPAAGGSDSRRVMTDGGTVTDITDGRIDNLEAEIARAERALESLETDTGDLIQALTTVRETISALEARDSNIVTELDSMTDRVEELEDGQVEPAELDRLRADVATLETRLAETPSEADLESIEDDLSDLAMRGYVDAQLDALTSVIDDVDTSVEELETAIEKGGSGTSDVDLATVDSLEATVDTLETDVESLADGLESLEADLAERESWETAVDDELAGLEERLENRGNSIETEAYPSQDDLEAVSADLESVAEDVESLSDDLESITADVESLSGGLESIRETAVDETDLHTATAGLADANRLRDVEEAIPMIAMTLENLESDVSARLERLDDYDSWASDEALDALENRLQTRLDGIHSELSSLDATLDEFDETVFELEQSVESTDETVRAIREDLREETGAVNNEFETLRERISVVETRISEVPDDTADSDRVNSLAESITDLRERLKTLERETVTAESVTAIQTNLVRTRRLVDTVDGTVEQLEPTVNELRSNVDADHQQLEAISSTIESVKTTIESNSALESDLKDVESSVDEVESSVDDIEGRLDGINGKIESDLKTLHMEVTDLREQVETDERSVLEQVVKDDVFGLVTVAFVAISAIAASMAFFDGQHVFTAVFVAVPVVTVLGAHLLAGRS
ncbi:hypothetical protein [Natrinema gelatinilyticum]|uniref:hypothetical protein n=1 Tax=Natrinema gelatinilyticum TaxID=2961571 RepID=UPI0020C3B18D|nr:hypothetical protein [Natrinema gelatinilyticum]